MSEAIFVMVDMKDHNNNHTPIAQLVERRTVVAALAGILRSLVKIWLGGQHFCKKILNK